MQAAARLAFVVSSDAARSLNVGCQADFGVDDERSHRIHLQ
jgi:hypothetical protein